MTARTVEGVAGGRRVVLAVAGGNFTQLGARLLLSPVVPLVLVEFDATKTSVGLALTGMWAVYALLQFPSGVLADRYGEYRLVLAGLVGTAVGAVLVATAPSLLAYGLFALVLGAGAGLFFSPASSLLSRLFDAQGEALGSLTAGGSVAGVAFPAVASFVAVRFGWRPAVALGALVAVPVAVVTVRSVPRLPPVTPDRRLRSVLDAGLILDLLGRPAVLYSTLLAVLLGFTFQAFSSFFPTFLVEYRGLATDTAGLAFAAVFGLSALAQPVAGRISDRLSRDIAIAGSVILAGAGFAALLFVPGLAGLLVGAALLGVGVSWPGPVQARLMDQFEEAERGFGFGLVRTTYMLLAASGSTVVGLLADGGGWPLAYGAVVGLLACCLLALALNRAVGPGL
ncbi:MAG: MFS transporter [Haloarculaceae archaeon]